MRLLEESKEDGDIYIFREDTKSHKMVKALGVTPNQFFKFIYFVITIALCEIIAFCFSNGKVCC